jgi:hypothetical protein
MLVASWGDTSGEEVYDASGGYLEDIYNDPTVHLMLHISQQATREEEEQNMRSKISREREREGGLCQGVGDDGAAKETRVSSAEVDGATRVSAGPCLSRPYSSS